MTSTARSSRRSRRAAPGRGGQPQHRLDVDRQHGHLRHDGADGDDQPGGGQADPTNASPINFTVVFSESVTGFTGAT